MTKLRICIGLIATALLISALPAHAGTAFRTAKVCFKTEFGEKLSSTAFSWTFPGTVGESKASNPNIGKKVGSCKPVLKATTNAQGKATFTLCPTKNTTITVKAPPLGIVSQSIAVKK